MLLVQDNQPSFMKKIKTFSYNKKDLALGIESNGICTIEANEHYLNCHEWRIH